LLKRVVFCDFDGTITAVETFAGMLKKFAPQLSAEIMPKLYNRTLTIREGVRTILESLPTNIYPEIIAYSQDKPIRSGLRELIDFLDSYSVPFVVVSGGLRDMVETVLSRQETAQKPLIKRIHTIEAVEVDISSDFLQVSSQFEGDTELVAKVKVMANYPAEEQIAIGDSITDLNMALKADIVFARDRLIEYMETENKPYIAWNDFFDIRNALEKQWKIDN
jgi:2-hydroxy-3-keto-5-methylthiopentenyl-1-phosphate phosphatase